MPRTDLSLWLDLECTGSGDDEDIVEIGCSLIEMESYAEVDFFSSLVMPRREKWEGMVQVVVELHAKSGLLDDIRKIQEYGGSRYDPAEVDERLVEWVKGIVGSNTTHIPLGGSGVTYYDRKYLKRDLPKFNDRITPWAYDIRPTERMFELVGLPWPTSSKTHRAIDDARWHASEFRYALATLRQLDVAEQKALAVAWPEMKPNDTFLHVDNG